MVDLQKTVMTTLDMIVMQTKNPKSLNVIDKKLIKEYIKNNVIILSANRLYISLKYTKNRGYIYIPIIYKEYKVSLKHE